jgi:hypothetical protein
MPYNTHVCNHFYMLASPIPGITTYAERNPNTAKMLVKACEMLLPPSSPHPMQPFCIGGPNSPSQYTPTKGQA